MFFPTQFPWAKDQTLGEHLEASGVSRRDFLEFCGQMAVLLGLTEMAAPRVAAALEGIKRPVVIWIQLQECTGCVESILRSGEPTIGDLILNLVSLDYSHTLMAASGTAAEAALTASMKANTGRVPPDGDRLGAAGRERDLHDDGRADRQGRADGGRRRRRGHHRHRRLRPLGQRPGRQARIPPARSASARSSRTSRSCNSTGCPPIAETVTATLVHYLTFGRLPELDAEGRPLFAYGARIHDQCPRRANFDAGQYVEVFDDDAARKGWCLYKVGCKGPATFSPCPIFQWNMKTSWPIGAGHPCIGCTERNFWDTMTPFYDRLPERGRLRHRADGRHDRRRTRRSARWPGWPRTPPRPPSTRSGRDQARPRPPKGGSRWPGLRWSSTPSPGSRGTSGSRRRRRTG